MPFICPSCKKRFYGIEQQQYSDHIRVCGDGSGQLVIDVCESAINSCVLTEDVEAFFSNVCCRRDSNQHKARRKWNVIKKYIPQKVATDFEIEWEHFQRSRSLSEDNEFKSHVYELRRYINDKILGVENV